MKTNMPSPMRRLPRPRPNLVWDRAKELIRPTLEPEVLSSFIEPLIPISVTGKKLVLNAGNYIIQQHVQQKLLDDLSAAVRRVHPGVKGVELYVPPSNAQPEEQGDPKTLNSCLNERYQLDNFTCADGVNSTAHGLIQSFLAREDDDRCLWLYGPAGTGKSHLLHALGNAFKKEDKNAKIFHENGKAFLTRCIAATRSASMHELSRFRNTRGGLNLWILDDFDALMGSNKERTQEEFLRIYQVLVEEGNGLIALSLSRHIKNARCPEELRSRLCEQSSAGLALPDLKLRTIFIDELDKEFKLSLSKKTLSWLSTRLKGQGKREITGILKRIRDEKRHNESFSEDDIPDLVIESLGSFHTTAPSMPIVITKTAEQYNLRDEDLLTNSRRHEALRPRQMAMFLCRELCGRTYPEIGRAFRGKCHTTVMHSHKKIKEALENRDAEVEHHMRRICETLNVAVPSISKDRSMQE